MAEDEAWDSGHKLSQEHQGQEHGILRKQRDGAVRSVLIWREHRGECDETVTDQFEHPWATAARGEAAKQSKNNNDGSGPDKHIWRIGALLRRQREVGLQAHLPPDPDRQQDHTCELREDSRGRHSGH